MKHFILRVDLLASQRTDSCICSKPTNLANSELFIESIPILADGIHLAGKNNSRIISARTRSFENCFLVMQRLNRINITPNREEYEQFYPFSVCCRNFFNCKMTKMKCLDSHQANHWVSESRYSLNKTGEYAKRTKWLIDWMICKDQNERLKSFALFIELCFKMIHLIWTYSH